jgi:hypothetical protein
MEIYFSEGGDSPIEMSWQAASDCGFDPAESATAASDADVAAAERQQNPRRKRV